MEITTSAIWWNVVKYISASEKITREESAKIVNENDVWLINMVEANNETDVVFLGNCILDFSEPEE